MQSIHTKLVIISESKYLSKSYIIGPIIGREFNEFVENFRIWNIFFCSDVIEDKISYFHVKMNCFTDITMGIFSTSYNLRH